MFNLLTTFLAYLIDKKFGEFTFIRHPIILIGSLISFFESYFYKNSILRGFYLLFFVLTVVTIISYSLESLLDSFHPLLNLLLTSIISSMFIAHKMLHDVIYDLINEDILESKREKIAMLVSRDTKNLTLSEINKAAIETYAENLSDGVIAPMFYLLLFNLPGIIIYKAINTMDSMVGYRNTRYENYGKVVAIVDDIANFVPSRITAILIMLIAKQNNLFAFYKDGKKHDSPNAGLPITAMALALKIKLGGDTSYFGTIKKKASFGEGKEEITTQDVKKALALL